MIESATKGSFLQIAQRKDLRLAPKTSCLQVSRKERSGNFYRQATLSRGPFGGHHWPEMPPSDLGVAWEVQSVAPGGCGNLRPFGRDRAPMQLVAKCNKKGVALTPELHLDEGLVDR